MIRTHANHTTLCNAKKNTQRFHQANPLTGDSCNAIRLGKRKEEEEGIVDVNSITHKRSRTRAYTLTPNTNTRRHTCICTIRLGRKRGKETCRKYRYIRARANVYTRAQCDRHHSISSKAHPLFINHMFINFYAGCLIQFFLFLNYNELYRVNKQCGSIATILLIE